MSNKAGLLAYVYSDRYFTSPFRVLSGTRLVVILGEPGSTRPSEDAPGVRLQPSHVPGYPPVAIPVKQKPAGSGGLAFGGCFIWSSDSRFPSKAPIALHDRFEFPVHDE